MSHILVLFLSPWISLRRRCSPVFLAVTISGTLGILIHAPYIFEYIDQEEIRKRLINSQDGVL